MFSLQLPFSRTWELRQFSTQLMITAFSMGCRAGGWVLFRTSDRHAKGSVNVPTAGDLRPRKRMGRLGQNGQSMA